MRDDYETLQREVVGLRLRVAELQRAAARHEETEGVSLAEREELLRDAERVAHLGTWTWDIASGRVTWSEELHRILGIEPGSVTPSVEAYMSRLHPEDRLRAEQAAEYSTSEGVLPRIQYRVVRPDGSLRHTMTSSVMLFDASGTVRRIVGGILDRTESLEAEAKLRHALGLLEEAQRCAQLGSWRYSPRLGELEWSQEFRRIAGLSADVEPRAELFLERVVPEDRGRFAVGPPETFDAYLDRDIEARLQRPDGQIRHVRVRGFAVLDLDGQREFRGTMLDVTDQVRMREELVHAQKMEAVGRLAGGIAHDFNNLLTVILGNLDLLAHRRGACPEIETSLQALSSAASLTHRLLAFGRQAQLSLKLVDPNDLVHSMTALMQRLVGDEVRLAIELSPGLPSVRVDALELERALVNLVVNARDAMPQGGVVTIGTRAYGRDASSGATQVAFSVGDEGAGIDEAVRPHIFEPFFTTRRQAGGTGLGLATVLGTAEQHGGTVHVEARPGGGTVFTIVLPAAAPASQRAPVTRSRGPSPTRELAPLQLLIIDDEAKVAEVTRRILESRGHAVEVASEPEHALAIWAARGTTIDLVICDVAMAKMRGPDLVLRMGAAGPKPCVLFVTGYSEEAVRSELGHPVLNKPYTTDRLLAAIVDALGDPCGDREGSR
ncbi:MAG: domain S-box protein [Myxococcaceae bacterium]|nr:domain S-box protein [Myxococcaceae bacterium]